MGRSVDFKLTHYHAQIYLHALRDVLTDAEITEAEAEDLAKLRRMLKKLGWAP